MSVSYVTSASAKSTNLTDQTSVVCSKPTGTVEGDIMVAVFTAPYTGSLTYTAPSGWSLASSHNGGGGVSLYSGLYYKIAGASEPSSYTFQCSAGGSLVVGISTYRADHNGWNLYFASTQGTTGTVTQPSMTPAGGEPFLASHAISWHDSGSSGSGCTSSTPSEEWDLSTTDGSPSTHERGSACYVNLSGTSGGGTDSGATMTISTGQTSYVAWTFGVSEEPNGTAASTMGGFTSSLDATEQVAVYRSTATATSPAGTNVTSLTIDKPAGTEDDDYMVAVISTNNTTTTAPSGWTLLEGPTTDGSGLSTYLYQKKAASEGSDYTWTFANAGGKTGSISSFSNSTGVDSWLSNVTHTTDPATGDALTPTGPAIRYDVFAWREQADATVTWDTGTETHDVVTHNSGGVRVGQSGTYEQTSVAGGGTMAAATANPTGTLTFSVMWSMAIGSKVTATGSLGSTLGGFTSSLAGSVGGGALGVTLGGFTASLSGTELTGGPLGSTMGGFSSAFVGERLVTGPLAGTLGGFTSVFVGKDKGVKVELLIGDTWTNVTQYVRYEDAVNISTGRQSSGDTLTTAMAHFTLDNREDSAQSRFSLRNAEGPYYGKIGRNTQCRITKAEAAYRFWGEISAWTPSADDTDNDRYVKIEAAGITRRMGAASAVQAPALPREISAASPLAYWPCDEQSGASSIASGLPGGSHIAVQGTPDYASYTKLVCSDAMPQVASSTWSSPTVQGSNLADGDVTLAFLMAIPQGGIASRAILLEIKIPFHSATLGDLIGTFYLVYRGDSDGDLGIGTTPMNLGGGEAHGAVPLVGTNGVMIYIGISDSLNETKLWYQGETDETPVLAATHDLTASGLNGPISFVANPDGLTFGTTASFYLSNISVWSGYGPGDGDVPTFASVGAYAGEKAGTRFARICTEEGITHTVNNASNSSAMGPQLAKSTLDLLKECEATDLGIMYEPRDSFGLGYIVRRDLYNQDVALTLDYEAGDLSSQLQPTYDDKDVENDVTVQRSGGSSARYVVDSNSTLSTQDPPDGVGAYKASVTVSLANDTQCYPQAGWRAHLGTVDEERITSVGIAMENPRFAADSSFQDEAYAVAPGSRITVSNPPGWAGVVDQIVQGYSEKFDNFTHDITYNTISAAPYNTAVATTTPSSTTAKADSLTSTLAANIDSDDTSVSVAVTGVLWTVNDSADFDIIVGGEVMNVTAVSGTTSPQTFTVTRAVNGVSKSHDSASQVRLYKPAIVGL